MPKGVHRRQPVGNVDLAPTILDFANATAGRLQDGVSLAPGICSTQKGHFFIKASLCLIEKSLEKIIHSFCDLNGNTFPILGHFVHEKIRTTGIMLFIKRMSRFVRQYLCDLQGVGGHSSGGLACASCLDKGSGVVLASGPQRQFLGGTAELPHEKDPELGGPVDPCSVLDNEIAVLAASAHIDVRSLDAVAVDVLDRRNPKVNIGLGKVDPPHVTEPVRLLGGAIDSLGPDAGGSDRALGVRLHVMERDRHRSQGKGANE